ncbi:MAG: TolC family outer membrane protein [Paracoccaceae bacterium]
MILRSVKIGALALAMALGTGVAARAETLTDALIAAYRTSGLLDQNRALLRAADEDVAIAIARLRPVLNYALGVTHSYTALGRTNTLPASTLSTTGAIVELSASMLLYDFGGTRLRIDAAQENVLLLREALISVEQRVLLRAVVAYVNVRRDISIVELRENNFELVDQELQATRDRFEVGEITRTDVAIAEARLASSKATQAVAQGNLFVSREEYRAATGHFPGALPPPPFPPKFANSLTGARDVAHTNHPDILQAQRSVRLSELNIAIAQSTMRPSIYADARGSINDAGTQNSSIGISLSGPIYQGGSLMATRRKAAAQRDASLASLHLTGILVEQNVGNAWALLAVADAALVSTIQQISAAKIAFDGVREEARFGARTTLDVLTVEQDLLDAESNKIAADTSRYIAVYTLLQSMGLLTVDHLQLGIATYDPAIYYNAVKKAPIYNVSSQGKKLDSVLRRLGKSGN